MGVVMTLSGLSLILGLAAALALLADVPDPLFIATYLAEQWQTKLSILIGIEDAALESSTRDFAQNYLEFNEIQADFIAQKYSAEALIITAADVQRVAQEYLKTTNRSVVLTLPKPAAPKGGQQ